MPTASNLIDIRSATPADVPTIRSFIRALADYEKLTHMVVATEESLRRTLFGDRPAAEVLIASVDGVAAGFALFFQNYSTFIAKPGLYLEDLFVLPEHRKKGVAGALLRRLARIALERDYGRLEWSVLDWNEPAITFYRRIGADVLPDWRICRVTGDAIAHLAEGRR